MDFGHGVSKVGPLKVWENKIVKKVQICDKCGVRARSYDTETDLYSQNTLSPEQISSMKSGYRATRPIHTNERWCLNLDSSTRSCVYHICCGSYTLLSLMLHTCQTVWQLLDSAIRFKTLYITLILELKLNFSCLRLNITLLMLYYSYYWGGSPHAWLLTTVFYRSRLQGTVQEWTQCLQTAKIMLTHHSPALRSERAAGAHAASHSCTATAKKAK